MDQLKTTNSCDKPNRIDAKVLVLTAIACLLLCDPTNQLVAQQGTNGPLPARQPKERAPDLSIQANNVNRDAGNVISSVVFRGNNLVQEYDLRRNISTRPGRYFDPDLLQQDVSKLWRMPNIKRVNGPYIEQSPNGVVITFEIVERQHIGTLKFIGNRAITDRTLVKQSNLAVGQPLDLHQIKMAKNRLEDFYREKGFPKTEIEIMDIELVERGEVSFLIHEDRKQRVWGVSFVGNQFVSDARLRHFVKSKPGILKVVGGVANEDEIKQDIVRLESYYKSFGFFNARIGREVDESNGGRWLTIRYIIDEGPRYQIRNITFVGNRAFTSEQLNQMIELKPGGGVTPEFNVAKMNQDVVSLRDLYGSQGFVYSNVEAEPRFLEEPGILDIVYRIDEGEQYRVGQINVHFEGDSSITRREVALNRLSLKPGDLIDVREIRNSERRLGAAQIFAGPNAGPGQAPPRIVVKPKELQGLDPETQRIQRTANSGSSYGGSSSRGSSTRFR